MANPSWVVMTKGLNLPSARSSSRSCFILSVTLPPRGCAFNRLSCSIRKGFHLYYGATQHARQAGCLPRKSHVVGESTGSLRARKICITLYSFRARTRRSASLVKRSGRAKFHLGLLVATRCDKAGPSPNHAPRFCLRLRRVRSDAG